MRWTARRSIVGLLLARSLSMTAAMMTKSRFRSWPITETAALEPSCRFLVSVAAESVWEGWTVSRRRLFWQAMGLRVPASEIDGTSTDKACLSDALVSVGPAGRGAGVAEQRRHHQGKPLQRCMLDI